MTVDGIDVRGERAVATIDGDLTATNAGQWRTALGDAARNGVRHLVIDLSAAAIVDSAGIGLLLAAHNSLRKNGGQIEITNASADIVGLFQAMRLDKHFSVNGR
jgi:anti-anti-sigma factor